MTKMNGNVVMYQLSEEDKELIEEKKKAGIPNNHATVLPAIIVEDWGEGVLNLKVFGDGETDLWKTSIIHGFEPGQWHWMNEMPEEDLQSDPSS